MNATTTRIVLEGLEGNDPTQLHGLQLYLAPHLASIETLWWVAFFVTLLVAAVHASRYLRK